MPGVAFGSIAGGGDADCLYVMNNPNPDASNTWLTLDDLFHNPEDRRDEPRVPLRRSIRVLASAAAQEWDFKTVTLLDCSERGIAVLSESAMHEGEEFLVKAKLQRMIMVIYRVSHCTEIASRQYKIGAELVECVGKPDEVLAGLLQAKTSQQSETRCWMRQRD